MTDKKQPEALRLANALEYCDASVARQAINELRRLHAELEALRAPHGQAPAQAVPAAVAGPSGYGPNVTVKRRCSDCKACNSESYAVQGDSGHYVYCEHPSLPESKYIGDTNWNTPHWCPVSAPTTQPAPKQEAQEPVAVVVPCHTPSGKRVALYSAKQDLPVGTQLYTAPQQAGWRLVPLEPTDEMLEATYAGQHCSDVYRDMLAAAPQPSPAAQEGKP